MADLREFIIKDVRCFQGEQRASIRPITLLIGENSTGKTSFLGSYRVLHQAMSANDPLRNLENLDNPDFNSEPFQMGAFRDIARSGRIKSGKTDEFMLGCSVENKNKKYDVLLTFIEKGSEPAVSSVRFMFPGGSFFDIRIKDQKLIIKTLDYEAKLNCYFPLSFFHLHFSNLYFRDFGIRELARMFKIPIEEVRKVRQVIQKECGINPASQVSRPSPYPKLKQAKSIAPLRSKPKRTYDPISESPTSEGEHIPMLMMRLLRTKDKDWGTLHDDLVEFGLQSGLFSEIKIKSHGKQINDPFQLQVKVRKGPQSNIMDVGYGVTQILPILVEIIHSDPTTFLLQQPEVHLHPRGQAEFSTFLAKAVNKKKHSFLIETHSDYIIDRVRISVRDKIINPEDVSIVYFEPESVGGSVRIYNIKVDNQGNLINPPTGYRNFFMKETDKLLGFESQD